MKGMNLTEQGKVVNALAPIDITGGAETDRFTMATHSHASIAVMVGVSAAAFTAIIVRAAEDAAGTNEEAIAFDYYAAGADSDVYGAKLSATTAGVTPSADDNITYMIEVVSDQLPEDKPWVSVELTNGANSVIAGVAAVLTGARYAGSESATVLA